MSQITDEQKEWINSLSCERLTHKESNQDEVLNFENNRNENLVDDLCSLAWKQDALNQTVYYVIKDKNQIIFFFSVRCGLLFQGSVSEEMKEICKGWEENTSDESIKNKISDIQVEKSLSDEELRVYLQRISERIRNQRKMERAEEVLGESPAVQCVDETFPAIELVHFCKNTLYTGFNQSLFSNHSLGEIIFWFKVLPVIQETLKNIGAEYLYLFAADTDENRTLINYYNTLLHFDSQSILGALKPSHNTACKFMCQNISEALLAKEDLLKEFNHSEEDYI